MGQITTTVKRQALFLTHSCSCAFNPKENFVYTKHLLPKRVHFYQPLNMYLVHFGVLYVFLYLKDSEMQPRHIS
jgi:hypothetical protein